MKSNPSESNRGDNYPVENVSLEDAKKFVNKLNDGSKKHKFRIPTESEWEFAARNRGKTNCYTGGPDNIDKYAWFYENSEGQTHVVASKAPSELGIYDMTGNVWEWCLDIHAWDGYKTHTRINPLFTGKGFRMVNRGGSWSNYRGEVNCTNRDRYNPNDKSSNLGIRLVKE